MRPEELDADLLEVALSALERGESYDDVAAGLPDRLRPRLEAADLLRQARPSPGLGTGPRPTFALGLEEQLRTDLRLQRSAPMPGGERPAPSPRISPLTAVKLLLLSLGVGGVFYLGVRQAGPGSVLYPVRQVVDEVRCALHPTHESRSQAHVDVGWQRIEDLRRHLESDSANPDQMAPILSGLTGAFAAALDAATASGDDVLVRRVEAEARLAAGELSKLDSDVDSLIGKARRQLLGPLVSRSAPKVGRARPTTALGAVTFEPTATEDAGESTPTPIGVSTEVEPQTEIAPVTSEPTVAVPSTPSVEPTASPTARPPDPTSPPATRERDEPTPTPVPPTPTADGDAGRAEATDDPRTPTRDSHPVTSTPPPPILPTATPREGTEFPGLTAVAPPTEPTPDPGSGSVTVVPPSVP